MTENQIKIMKLSSGEEIVCSLIADEHPRTYNVRYPMKVQAVPRITEDGVEESLSLTRWLHFADDDLADIPKTQVLAIVNASIGMKRFYEYCLKKIDDGELLDPTDEDLQDIEDYDEDLEALDEWEPNSKIVH